MRTAIPSVDDDQHKWQPETGHVRGEPGRWQEVGARRRQSTAEGRQTGGQKDRVDCGQLDNATGVNDDDAAAHAPIAVAGRQALHVRIGVHRIREGLPQGPQRVPAEARRAIAEIE